MIERFLLQGAEIGLQQAGNRNKAPRAGLRTVEQLVDDLEPFFLLEQAMVGYALVKQQFGRGQDVGRFQTAELLQGLFEPLPLHEPAAVVEPHVGGHERGCLGIGQEGGVWQVQAGAGMRTGIHKLRHPGINQGKSPGQRVQ